MIPEQPTGGGLRQRPGDQPLPVPNSSTDIQTLVIDDLCAMDDEVAAELARVVAERRELGISRYGHPLQSHNGRDAVLDASDEAVDMMVYLRQRAEETGHRFWRAMYEGARRFALDLRRVQLAGPDAELPPPPGVRADEDYDWQVTSGDGMTWQGFAGPANIQRWIEGVEGAGGSVTIIKVERRPRAAYAYEEVPWPPAEPAVAVAHG